VETRTGRSDGDERNMGDEVLGLGVFLYRDEATKMIVALMREREFFFLDEQLEVGKQGWLCFASSSTTSVHLCS
jgi:hypothetical protein